MAKAIAGVMGLGEGASVADLANAFEPDRLLAAAGWGVLSGSRCGQLFWEGTHWRRIAQAPAEINRAG